MGGQGSKEKRPVSGAVHLRDKKELCGVGLIFRRSPDGSVLSSLQVPVSVDSRGQSVAKRGEAGERRVWEVAKRMRFDGLRGQGIIFSGRSLRGFGCPGGCNSLDWQELSSDGADHWQGNWL